MKTLEFIFSLCIISIIPVGIIIISLKERLKKKQK